MKENVSGSFVALMGLGAALDALIVHSMSAI